MPKKVSYVDQAVITRALLAGAHEMGAKLIRSAHSPIVREAQDCSAALLDRRGNVVAQSELIALQLGSITHTFRPCLELYDLDEIEPDDFFINNDPFHGGQHLPDIFIFSPVFFEDELVGFSATVVHHIDLGGGAPGLNPKAGDIHQEGLVFPPTKYSLTRDWNGGGLERFIASNVRMPEATIGDLNAQFAANAIGAERIRELCRKFGVDVVDAAMVEMLDYAERRIRSAIRAVPDGEYHGEAMIDDDGIGQVPVRVKAKLTVEGDGIEVDFTGSDPQVKTNMNNPFASTEAAAIACLKSVLTDPDVPINDGSTRAIKVTAPLGSVLNPTPPAPVRARLLPSYRVFNAVMMALSEVVPERVIAPGYDTTTAACLSEFRDGKYNIYLEIFGGGYGGGAHSDGVDGIDCALSNCANIPMEAMELDYPFFRVENYALIPDSGGKGKHRGGLGFEKSYRILEDGVTFATYGDRFRIAPPGLFGGGPGRHAENLIERDGETIVVGSKAGLELKKGDLLVMRTGGGGGYGAASERDARLEAEDLEEGLITRAAE
ncbi:MAG: hydantoinase B/oxoprolinase family protein [Pseudomonadota bacterium]|nr:hydantoinase B/oxoprolinase family protein [Pseudomonadota bacterium]